MDSSREADRLLKKSDYQSTKDQLLETGLSSGMLAMDAGGGAGFVTKIMHEIVGDAGRVSLVDLSQERLSVARQHTGGPNNIDFVASDLAKIPVASNSYDYIFCRFVFEYLPDPQSVLKEFFRIIKPGGHVVVGDLDHNILSHYPISKELESQYLEIVTQLEKMKSWDPYVGRKLYTWFYEQGFSNIDVSFRAHHLIYGPLQTRDRENMQSKFDQVGDLIAAGRIQVGFDFKVFVKEFMEFFESPGRFSYSPLVIVRATKAKES